MGNSVAGIKRISVCGGGNADRQVLRIIGDVYKVKVSPGTTFNVSIPGSCIFMGDLSGKGFGSVIWREDVVE